MTETEPNTILAVADNFKLLDLVKVNCVAQGINCLTATSGAEAIRTIQKRVPKLIILDTMKLEMDGWKVCEFIRETYQESIKIIMLVTQDWEPTQAILNLVPMPDEYVVKPIDTRGLFSSAKQLLSDTI